MPTIIRSTSCRQTNSWSNFPERGRRLRWSYADQVWIDTKSGNYQSIRMHICVLFCKGRPFRTCIGSHHSRLYCNLVKIHISTRQACNHMEWPWHEFRRACREIKELYAHLKKIYTEQIIADFCVEQGIQWNFTPEHAPHFGGLWEAAVKSFKRHFRCVVGDVCLSYEELTTVLTQIEACLYSRPLTPLPLPEDDIEALKPSHFLDWRPHKSLTGPSSVVSQVIILMTLASLSNSCTTALEALVYRVPDKPTATVEMESSFLKLTSCQCSLRTRGSF